MTTGRKIEKLRKQLEMTTDDLAKKLDVSRQTIYKWETDMALPDVPHLKQLAAVFNVTTDYLLIDDEISSPKDIDNKYVNNAEVVEAKSQLPDAANNDGANVEYICMTCGKILRKNDLSYPHKEHYGNPRHIRVENGVECEGCHNARLEREALETANQVNKMRIRRIWNYITLGILLSATLAGSIYFFATGQNFIGLVILVPGLLTTFAVPTIILNNTFVSDVFLDITEWGCVSFPGIIFSLDFDGLVFLITVKILFFILGLVVIVGAVVIAIAIAGVLSIFLYPYALYKSYRKPTE